MAWTKQRCSSGVHLKRGTFDLMYCLTAPSLPQLPMLCCSLWSLSKHSVVEYKRPSLSCVVLPQHQKGTKRLRLAHKKCGFLLSVLYISEREKEKKNKLFAPHANRNQRGAKEREKRNITRENEKTKKTCVRALQIP